MDIIPVSDITTTLQAINTSLDEIALLLGKLSIAATTLWWSLAPLVKLAMKGKLPKWFGGVAHGLQKLSGPFAVNGEPLKKKDQ